MLRLRALRCKSSIVFLECPPGRRSFNWAQTGNVKQHRRAEFLSAIYFEFIASFSLNNIGRLVLVPLFITVFSIFHDVLKSDLCLFALWPLLITKFISSLSISFIDLFRSVITAKNTNKSQHGCSFFLYQIKHQPCWYFCLYCKLGSDLINQHILYLLLLIILITIGKYVVN